MIKSEVYPELAISSELFDISPSRSQKTQLRIIEAAIRCYARYGAEAATFAKVAAAAKVSRPLILRYFPDYETLMESVGKYLRVHLQQWLVQSLAKVEGGPKARLSAYVDAHFEWAEKYPDYVRVGLYYFYLCSRNSKLMQIQSSFVDVGHKRITALIQKGQELGEFPAKVDPAQAARWIQIQISGALVALVSENPSKDLDSLRTLTQKLCRSCLNY